MNDYDTMPHDEIELRPPVRIEVNAAAADRLVKMMQEAGPAPEKLEGETVSDEAGVRRIIVLAGRAGLDVFVSEDRHVVTITQPGKADLKPDGGWWEHIQGAARKCADAVFDKVRSVAGYSGPMAKGNRNSPCQCGSGRKYKKCCRAKDVAGKRS